jgi:hypothetical protein
MTERQLTDTAILDERWAEATEDVFKHDEEIADQAVAHGLELADAVALGELAIGNLREFVNWANDLDREAVEAAGGSISNFEEADQREAVARRIAHLSGRNALGQVRSADRRRTHRIQYRRRNGIAEPRMPGLGSSDWMFR